MLTDPMHATGSLLTGIWYPNRERSSINIFTKIIAPIGIGIVTVIRSLAVSSRTGVGATFALVMGVASGVVMTVR